MNNKKISLIMATLGRKEEPERFLASLQAQSYRNFELIVVDQNEADYLNDIIMSYQEKFALKYIRIQEKGLSKARNIGLKYVTGDILGFPDDDCQYMKDTLEKVEREFSRRNCIGITGILVHTPVEMPVEKALKINLYNVWTRGISTTMFFKKTVVDVVGVFDEMLGVGSGTPYGSGEETDYMIRILKNNGVLFNVSSIIVQHPKENLKDDKIKEKAYNYSRGRMYVLKKNGYGALFKLCNIIYPLLKCTVYFYNPLKVRYCWHQFKGRL